MEKYERIMPILLTLALGVLILDFGLAMIEHFDTTKQQEIGADIWEQDQDKSHHAEGVCGCERNN